MALFCGRSLVGEMRASGEVCWKEFEFLRMPVECECKWVLSVAMHSVYNADIPLGLLGTSWGESWAVAV